MPLPLSDVRALYPHAQHQLYLNHAAISPFSTPVMTALEGYLHQRHLGEIENYYFMLPRIAELRALLARLVGAQAEDIAFAPNTSFGLNLLATGLDWRPGDRILLNTLEFPANVYPFLNCKRLGVEVDFVAPRNHVIHLEDLAAAITPRTRLLSISFVQFLTGQRHDLVALGRLCRERGVLFCVDGIQGLGAAGLDVEAMNIDFLASGGHKWLMGPQGQGFVYIRPQLLEQLTPAMVGWLSVQNAWQLLDFEMLLRPDAARLETGTFNGMGLMGLHAALQVFARWPLHQITEQVLDLSGFLIRGLKSLGLEVITPEDPAARLGIVTCLYPEADRLRQALEQRRIQISAREDKYLRFSPHYYNSREEIVAVLGILKERLQPPRQSFGMW